MKKAVSFVKKSAVVIASAVALNAHAAIDVATDIAAIKTDITTAGTALIGLAVAAMGIRWVKASFF